MNDLDLGNGGIRKKTGKIAPFKVENVDPGPRFLPFLLYAPGPCHGNPCPQINLCPCLTPRTRACLKPRDFSRLYNMRC